jgi:flagella basal body P-ring formation protein FlgA
MNTRRSVILLSLAVLASHSPAGQTVKVYLPREISCQARTLTVGDVAIVACADEKLQAQVKAVTVGRGALSRESLTVDRLAILSRLASAGIDRSSVEMSGAQSVKVRRPESHFPAKAVAGAGREALDRKDTKSGRPWQLRGQAKDMYFPKIGGARLEAEIEQHNDSDAKVTVKVVSGREVLASQELRFVRALKVERLVATRDIPAGVPLTSENTRKRTVTTTGKALEHKVALGQISRVAIAKGRTISSHMVRDFQAGPVVRRNSPVVMKISGQSFELTVAGVALQDGKTGDLIQIRNIDSKQVVVARVLADGTCTPVLER